PVTKSGQEVRLHFHALARHPSPDMRYATWASEDQQASQVCIERCRVPPLPGWRGFPLEILGGTPERPCELADWVDEKANAAFDARHAWSSMRSCHMH